MGPITTRRDNDTTVVTLDFQKDLTPKEKIKAIKEQIRQMNFLDFYGKTVKIICEDPYIAIYLYKRFAYPSKKFYYSDGKQEFIRLK